MMEAHLAPKQPFQVNKITSLCEICSGPHDTQYCMENPEQTFVEYASSRINKAGGKCQSNLEGLVSNFMASQDARLSKFEADFKQQQSELTNKIGVVLKAITEQITGALPSNTVKNLKLNVDSTSPVLSARFYPTKDPQCSTRINGDDGGMMFIELIKKNDDSRMEEPDVGENAEAREMGIEYFDIFPTRSELAYHKRRKLDPMEDSNRGVSNFTRRIKGMHIFVGNFTYVSDFMIVEDISSIIDPRLSQVVLGRPFIDVSNMSHDLSSGVHTKSVYLRNKKNKRRGVDYVMSKILGFYKERLELGPEYVTGLEDEGEVT
ncbi:hypothetical protein Tco_1490360 [Tanacetum coccineum]